MPHTIKADTLAFALCIVLAGFVSIWLGQDSNWDLWNYHFYNAWAFVHGRLTWDVAPAQIQTYFNPIADLPFYAMVAAGWPPQLISFVLAIPTGVTAWLLVKLLWLVFSDLPGKQRLYGTAMAWLIGMTASHAVGVIGTTTNDWTGVPLIIAALWVMLRAIIAREDTVRPFIVGGVLTGLALGLKLSNAHFAAGTAIALLFRSQPLQRSVREAIFFSVSVIVGVLIAGGYWMTVLWVNFESPFFPFFNNWIHSPWWISHPGSFRVYGPHALIEWFTFPFWYFRQAASLLSENFFRDWRFPLAYLLAIALTLRWAWHKGKLHFFGGRTVEPSGVNARWKFLVVFWLVSFLIWAAQHSIERYIIVLEVLSGALLVAAVRALVPVRYLMPSIAVMALIAIAPTTYPKMGRTEYRSQWFNVQVPPVEPQALVLLLSDNPMSFMLPFFPADARFVGIDNTFNDIRFMPWLAETKMYARMQQIVKTHKGPIYSLTQPSGKGDEVLASYGVRQIKDSCREISTNMATSAFELCMLERSRE